MAERRMFAKTIVLSDAFLDMPTSARCLYFTLGMFADDDGFVNSPKGIMRQCGASDGDMQILLDKKFVLLFESGVIVIKHWRIHNYIQKDRYKPTKYKDEFEQLETDENGGYRLDTKCIQNVYKVDTQDRLGKERISKVNTLEPIPLEDGSDWFISDDELEEFKKAYPSINVEGELKKMRAWCLSNPSKRKTKRGIGKFVNNWLSRASEKPQSAPKKERQNIPDYMLNADISDDKASQAQIDELMEMMKKL